MQAARTRRARLVAPVARLDRARSTARVARARDAGALRPVARARTPTSLRAVRARGRRLHTVSHALTPSSQHGCPCLEAPTPRSCPRGVFPRHAVTCVSSGLRCDDLTTRLPVRWDVANGDLIFSRGCPRDRITARVTHPPSGCPWDDAVSRRMRAPGCPCVCVHLATLLTARLPA